MIPFIFVDDVHLGPIPLHPFGILVATGVLIGTALTTRRARKLGYDLHKLNSFVTWMLVAGFIGGHVFDEIFYHLDTLAREPFKIFFLWEGLSSFGGFLGALIGIVLWKYFELRRGFFRRRAEPQPLLPFADLVLSVFPVAWIFGRSGCSVVHDHPGAQAAADAPFAVAYPVLHTYDLTRKESWHFHGVSKLGPLEFYQGDYPRYDLGTLELLFTIIVAACFVITWRRKLPTGSYVVVTALAYAPVRFVMDFLRLSDAEGGDVRFDLLLHPIRGEVTSSIGPALTPAQWFCTLLFVFGLVMAWRVYDLRRRGVDPALRVMLEAES